MNDVKSYVPSVQLGEVMVGQATGEVVESRDARFAPGDKVLAPSGWQLYSTIRGGELTKIDTRRAPASYYLGVLGMPGFTAWFGLLEIGKPKAGETVVLGGFGCGRQRRRAACENSRLPRRRHRRWTGEVRLRGAGARV